jgi:secreted Zn-dependent insulinase-like peptidase
VEQITEAFFTYVQLIKSKGVRPDIYAQEAFVSKLNFYYKTFRNSLDEARTLSKGLMVDIDEKALWNYDTLLDNYRKSEITELLDYLNPDNIQILMGGSFNNFDTMERTAYTPGRERIL